MKKIVNESNHVTADDLSKGKKPFHFAGPKATAMTDKQRMKRNKRKALRQKLKR